MNKYSMTIGGIVVMLLGTVFVDSFGISESCSTELTSKVAEYAPLVIGGGIAWIGRLRHGGVNLLGFKA